MHRAEAYELLCQALAAAGALPSAELARRAVRATRESTVLIGSEPLQIDIDVAWQGADRTVVQITAHALGTSTWRLQRISEHMVVHLKEGKACRPAPASDLRTPPSDHVRPCPAECGE